MTFIEARSVLLPSSTLLKMEERKRPASYDTEDVAPPLKKHASNLNGSTKRHDDSDLPGKDELEVSDSHSIKLEIAIRRMN